MAHPRTQTLLPTRPATGTQERTRMSPGVRLPRHATGAGADAVRYGSRADGRRCGDPAPGIDARAGQRRAWFPLVACLVSMLAACTPASVPAAAADRQPLLAADEASPCASDTFETFVERFGRDVAFQKLATADPLVVEHYDVAAEPEPRLVTARVPLDEVAWPVMPFLDTLGARGRAYEIRPSAQGRMELQIHTPDTSDQQTYVFDRTPCWQLQRVVDASI